MEQAQYFRLLDLPLELRLIILEWVFGTVTLSLIWHNGKVQCVYTPPEVMQRDVFDAEALKKAIAPDALEPEKTLQPPNMICRVNKQLRSEALPILAQRSNILLCPELPPSNPFSRRQGLLAGTLPPEGFHEIDARAILGETFRNSIQGVCVSLQSTVIVDHSTLPNLERVSLDGYLDPHSAIGWDHDVVKNENVENSSVKHFNDEDLLSGCPTEFLRADITEPFNGVSLTLSTSLRATDRDAPASDMMSSKGGSELRSLPHQHATGESCTPSVHSTRSPHSQGAMPSRILPPTGITNGGYMPRAGAHRNPVRRTVPHSGSVWPRQAPPGTWITLPQLHSVHGQLTRRLSQEASLNKALSRLEQNLSLFVADCFTAPSTSSRSATIHPMWIRKWWLELVWVPRHLEQLLGDLHRGKRLLQDVMRSLGLLYLFAADVNEHDGETKVVAVVEMDTAKALRELQSRRGKRGEIDVSVTGVELDDRDWVAAVLDALAGEKDLTIDSGSASTEDSGGIVAPSSGKKRPVKQKPPEMAVQQAFMLNNDAKNDSYLVATVNLTRNELISGRVGDNSLAPIDVSPTSWLEELNGHRIGSSGSLASSCCQTHPPLSKADAIEDGVVMPVIITPSSGAYHAMLNYVPPTFHPGHHDDKGDHSHLLPESSSAVKGKKRADCAPSSLPLPEFSNTPSYVGNTSDPFLRTTPCPRSVSHYDTGLSPLVQGRPPYRGQFNLSTNPKPCLKTPLVPPWSDPTTTFSPLPVPTINFPPAPPPAINFAPPSSPSPSPSPLPMKFPPSHHPSPFPSLLTCPSPSPSTISSPSPSPSPSPLPATGPTFFPHQPPFAEIQATYAAEQSYARDLWTEVMSLRRQIHDLHASAASERKVTFDEKGEAGVRGILGSDSGMRVREE